jgi:hypothetical protein
LHAQMKCGPLTFMNFWRQFYINVRNESQTGLQQTANIVILDKCTFVTKL